MSRSRRAFDAPAGFGTRYECRHIRPADDRLDEHAGFRERLLQLCHRTVLQLREGGDSELALPVGLNGTVEEPTGHPRLACRGLVGIELRPPAVAVSPATTTRQSRVPEPTG